MNASLIVDGLLKLPARLRSGRITGQFEVRELAEIIQSGTIVILQGVFARDAVLALRREVFDWALGQPPNDPTAENFHVILQGVSRLQKTAHAYHAYNLEDAYRFAADLGSGRALDFFEPLKDLQNALNGVRNPSLVTKVDGYRFHPQLIQYPLGGGQLGRHVHPLEPQRVGTIVSCSQRGVDYQTGGTCFETPNGDGDGVRVVDIEEHHDIGDVAFFRFDLPHWVKPVDPALTIDWSAPSGRWVLAMPYYNQPAR
jgi:hypothetical protein